MTNQVQETSSGLGKSAIPSFLNLFNMQEKKKSTFYLFTFEMKAMCTFIFTDSMNG